MALHDRTALQQTAQAPTPTRPDRITIWPVDECSFGIDVQYQGAVGYRRAEIVHRQIEAAGAKASFRQEVDGTWTVRFGPVERDVMLAALGGVVW